MHRMLIVDDEPIIVDGMVNLFLEESNMDLEIYHAYSGDDALELLAQHKIDVVLSDIRMPGISGLELLEEIRGQWPHCKVVFLTAHNDTAYIRQAMRSGGADYLLKTESEEAIIQSVRKALEQADIEKNNLKFLEKSQAQLKVAQPMLLRELLLGFCESTTDLTDHQLKLAHELEMQLDLNAQVLLVIGRIDRWKDSLGYSDKALLRYAIENIMQECLSLCVMQAATIDETKFVCFIQPTAVGQTTEEQAVNWSKVSRFVHGTLETVQGICQDLLNLSVSFAASGQAVSWREVHTGYKSLRERIGRGLGLGKMTLLIEGQEPIVEASHTTKQKQALRQSVARLSELKSWFETGRAQLLQELLAEIAEQVRPLQGDVVFIREIYYAISIKLLTQISEWGQETEIAANDLELDKLTNVMLHADVDEAFAYLIRVAKTLAQVMAYEQEENTHAVVTTIQHYIQQHLDQDLSLTTLAGIVHLNANYLSRLYKQITGVSMTDAILNIRLTEAKRWLEQSFLRIHEVSRRVGFDNPAYFARVFRKATGMSPQEYRELEMNKSPLSHKTSNEMNQ